MRVALAVIGLAGVLAGCTSGQTAAPPPRACDQIPGATTDASTDRTGEDNTERRVERVGRRVEAAVRTCPGLTGIGVGSLRLSGGLRPKDCGADVPPLRGLIPPSDPYHYISVMVRERVYLPKEPLFVDGVPLCYIVGEFRAL